MTRAIQLLLRTTWVLVVLGIADRPAFARQVDGGSAAKSAISFQSLGLQRAIVDRAALDDLQHLGEECGTAPAIAMIVDDYRRGLTAMEIELQSRDNELDAAGLRRLASDLRQRTRELWESAEVLCQDRIADLVASRRSWARRTWLLPPGEMSQATFSRGIDLVEFVRRDFETRVAFLRSRQVSLSPELVELRRLLDEYASELDPLIASYADDVLANSLTGFELNEHWYALDRAGRKHAQRIADWIGRRSGAKAALLWRERFLRANDPAYFGILTADERRVETAIAVNLPDGEELPIEVRTLLDARWSVAAELRTRMWRDWLAFLRQQEPSDELRRAVAELEWRLNAAGAAAWRRLCRCAGEGDAPPARAMWGFWIPSATAD